MGRASEDPAIIDRAPSMRAAGSSRCRGAVSRPMGRRTTPRPAWMLAEGIGGIPGAVVLNDVVLNDVVYTQVSVAFESDERTRQIFDRPVTEGTVMLSASVGHGRTVIRFLVSSWRIGDREVRDTVAAVARAALVPARRPTAVGE